ncbi:MAG: cytochrome c [Pseudomonadota bacterium]
MKLPMESAAAILLAIVLAPTLARADARLKERILSEGKDDYQVHCAACHGAGGKGDGPMAKLLIKPPSDLTGIAARSGGQLPFWRVFDIVSGRAAVVGHDTFQMPQFWSRLRADEGRLGYAEAHVRVLLLTHYLESIQASPRP